MEVGYTGVNKTKVLGFCGKWYHRRDTGKKDSQHPLGNRYVCPEGCGALMQASFYDKGPTSSNCGQLIVHKVCVILFCCVLTFIHVRKR